MKEHYLPLLLLTGILFPANAVKFSIVGPGRPVVGVVGGTVTLECHLEPKEPIDKMTVRWLKSDLDFAVHMFRNGKDETNTQDDDYRGRTELFKDQMVEGNASLRIKDIRVTDEGNYICSVDNGVVFEETPIDLKVGGLGHDHWIYIRGYEKSGIQLVCESTGWYPAPSIQWIGGEKENLTSKSEINFQQDSKQLLNAQSKVTVSQGSTNKFRCILWNRVLEKDQEAIIEIADLEKDKSVQQYDKWEPLVKSDWEIMYENKVSIQLEIEAGVTQLTVSKDGKSVTAKEMEKNPPNNYAMVKASEWARGTEGFSSGKKYWEVEVAGNRKWTLGVVAGTVNNAGDLEIKHDWTIGQSEKKIQANLAKPLDITYHEFPSKIGVYLDYDSRVVSFFIANSKSFLHTFTECEFTEKVYPYFRTSHANKMLKICPLDSPAKDS
ncbi:butyrophilin subfamily 3 member A3-like isoform X2 [Amblyraja radiata]|uniref:butyrophilin subfamily 3 member A3-like isoform X2 n=1 Tax=Amblyraja radiata TaxID=386614 RepID=UPI001402B856|nr:butyrophilin subfamily 3 member A3-like isoform X2 [Amblyraja radiata]